MESVVVGYVILTYSYYRDGRKWVGTCLELGTSTYAKTRKQVLDALGSLVVDHLNLLERSGERIRFFDEWGIRLYPTIPAIQEVAPEPKSEFDAGLAEAAAPHHLRQVLPVGGPSLA